MPVKQGDLELLQHPASKELLQSKIPARLAYISTDGTPAAVPWCRNRTKPECRSPVPRGSRGRIAGPSDTGTNPNYGFTSFTALDSSQGSF